MFVYVRNQDGEPLMPCTPAKARKLLRAGKARVVERSPFTIQLHWLCEGHVQEVRAGIDKGSHTTGICCIGKGQALLSAEIHHRKDVKEKMDDRRDRRKSPWEGDIVLVKKQWVKQVNAIYAVGRFAFKRVKGEPANAKPEDCHLLEREQTIIWEKCHETPENARFS